MRSRISLITLVLLFVSSLPALAQWNSGRDRRAEPGACFYQDTQFRGSYFCMKPGDRWARLPHGFGDTISSIRVFGRARVRVFNDSNFRGPNALFDGDAPNLGRVRMGRDQSRNWGDRISSIAVSRDRWDQSDQRDQRDLSDQQDRRDSDRDRRPEAKACFFKDAHFRGSYFCMKPGDRWARLPHGFGDTISSIRVFGRARVRVFNDSNFRGPNALFDGDAPNLGRVRMGRDRSRNWGDRISSIAVSQDRWDRRERREDRDRDDGYRNDGY